MSGGRGTRRTWPSSSEALPVSHGSELPPDQFVHQEIGHLRKLTGRSVMAALREWPCLDNLFAEGAELIDGRIESWT